MKKAKGYKNLVLAIAGVMLLFFFFSYLSLLNEVAYLKKERSQLLKLVLKQRELQGSLFEENDTLKEKMCSGKQKTGGNAGFVLKEGRPAN